MNADAEWNPEVQRLLDEHLESVERALSSSGVSRTERRRITDDLELQIREMLAARAGANPNEADMRAILAELDPAEAYGSEAASDAIDHVLVRRPQLRRSARERKLGGVCSGIAEHLGISPWLVRIAFMLLQPAGALLVYVVLWWVLPLDDPRQSWRAPVPLSFVVLLLVVWGLFIAIVIKIVPKMQDMWNQLGGVLPPASRLLMNYSNWLLHSALGIPAQLVLLASLYVFYAILPPRGRLILVLLLCVGLPAFVVYAIYLPLFSIPRLIK